MTPACPSELDLVRYVDDDLVPETRERIDAHLPQCTQCSQHVRTLRGLLGDLRVAAEGTLDFAKHHAEVMQRVRSGKPKRTSPLVWLSISSSAAAGVALAWAVASRPAELPAESAQSSAWQARGAQSERALPRDVGVQLYALEAHSRPLVPGDHFNRVVPLTLGLRNLGLVTTHVMVLLIDRTETLHWITPEFTDPDSNPSSTTLPPSTDERRLGSSVVFDELVAGPVRVLILISPAPLQVSQFEQLPTSQLQSRFLSQHFVGLEVRELALEALAQPNSMQGAP